MDYLFLLTQFAGHEQKLHGLSTRNFCAHYGCKVDSTLLSMYTAGRKFQVTGEAATAILVSCRMHAAPFLIQRKVETATKIQMSGPVYTAHFLFQRKGEAVGNTRR